METERETRKQRLIVIDGGKQREKDGENEVLGETRERRWQHTNGKKGRKMIGVCFK